MAAGLGIRPEVKLEPYRPAYKAKLTDSLWRRVSGEPNGKLILVTAVNPTPAGEGKTTTTVGLGQAMAKIGRRAVIALREPSLGPVFGVKGGAAGGGYAQVLPMEDINLHFTGDMHAITAANNLLCALIDNHLQQGNALSIDPRRILFKRCLDMNDRALRQCNRRPGRQSQRRSAGGRFSNHGCQRSHGHSLSWRADLEDLKERLGSILVAYNALTERPVYCRGFGREGRYGCPSPGRHQAKPGADRWRIRRRSCMAGRLPTSPTAAVRSGPPGWG